MGTAFTSGDVVRRPLLIPRVHLYSVGPMYRWRAAATWNTSGPYRVGFGVVVHGRCLSIRWARTRWKPAPRGL